MLETREETRLEEASASLLWSGTGVVRVCCRIPLLHNKKIRLIFSYPTTSALIKFSAADFVPGLFTTYSGHKRYLMLEIRLLKTKIKPHHVTKETEFSLAYRKL